MTGRSGEFSVLTDKADVDRKVVQVNIDVSKYYSKYRLVIRKNLRIVF